MFFRKISGEPTIAGLSLRQYLAKYAFNPPLSDREYNVLAVGFNSLAEIPYNLVELTDDDQFTDFFCSGFYERSLVGVSPQKYNIFSKTETHTHRKFFDKANALLRTCCPACDHVQKGIIGNNHIYFCEKCGLAMQAIEHTLKCQYAERFSTNRINNSNVAVESGLVVSVEKLTYSEIRPGLLMEKKLVGFLCPYCANTIYGQEAVLFLESEYRNIAFFKEMCYHCGEPFLLHGSMTYTILDEQKSTI